MTRALFPRLVAASVGLALVLACGGVAPDLDQKKKVRTDRVTFEHPGNWTAGFEPDRIEGLFMGIHEIEGGESAMVFLTIYDATAPFDAGDIADMYMDALPGELGGIGLKQTGRSAVKRQLNGVETDGVEVHFSADLLGIEVPHTLQVFTMLSESHSATVITQIADEDIGTEQPGIDLVLDTVKLQ